MARYILKYKLHNGETPWFVEKAGLFERNGWFYGVSRNDNDCYIPSDIIKLTKEQLKTWLRTHELRDPDGIVLTDEQKDRNVEDRFKL